MADDKMNAGDDPKDFTVDQVNDFLATADDDEKARVLDAEGSEDGKQRVGITEGPNAESDEDEAADEAAEEAAAEPELRPITAADLNPAYYPPVED